MPALVVIPARYSSTRFPGKVLAPLLGKPLIQHVYENSLGSRLASEVLVATDSEEVARAARAFGAKAVMTSASHPSGTDRVAEACSGGAYSEYDIIVNVQGDEPLMRPEIIDSAIALLEDGRASVGTLSTRIKKPGEVLDPNVVKVVFDHEGFAMYFSRSPVPYHRGIWKDLASASAEGSAVYKHFGIYSYRREALTRLTGLEPTALEKTEALEQLRALENGMKIKVAVTEFDTIGVDTPDDLERVRLWLSSSS